MCKRFVGSVGQEGMSGEQAGEQVSEQVGEQVKIRG